MQQEPIHIVFCVNDKYVPYIAVTIKSITENHSGSRIYMYLLTDGVSDSNQQMLYTITNYLDNVTLQIYKINDSLLRDLKTGYWTIYTWYRILIPQILSNDIKKILYLDADTLVKTDLRALFAIDMTGRSIAAALDIQSFDSDVFERCGYEPFKQYICAGVLLMNLEYWRENRLTEMIIEWARHNSDRLKCPDQDAINYICRDTKIVLPLRYGILQWFFKNENFYRSPYCDQLKECITNPAIIHYAGCAPWYNDGVKHIMRREWFKYNKMLKHPVKCSYYADGFTIVKIICWNILHPLSRCRQLSLKRVKRRLFSI